MHTFFEYRTDIEKTYKFSDFNINSHFFVDFQAFFLNQYVPTSRLKADRTNHFAIGVSSPFT